MGTDGCLLGSGSRSSRIGKGKPGNDVGAGSRPKRARVADDDADPELPDRLLDGGPAGGLGRSKSPHPHTFTTENLLENTDGGTPTPSSFPPGSTLLPSIYADARYVDAVIASKALADAPRYLLYVAKLSGVEGSIVGTLLNGIRYNFFLVLYPAGLCLELYLQYCYREGAIAAGGEGFWIEPTMGLPAWALAVCVGFFPLYSHMLKQRKKYNKKSNDKKE